MKNIFQLEEGKTYKAIKNGQELHRKFRVSQGKLENDGLGRFAVCDWAPVDASLKFKETAFTEGPIARLMNKAWGVISSLFSKKASSFLTLKENTIYESNCPALPESLYLEEGVLKNFKTKSPVSLSRLSLNTEFKALGPVMTETPQVDPIVENTPTTAPPASVESQVPARRPRIGERVKP